MLVNLAPSPTPKNTGDAYASLIGDHAGAAAGTDGRVTEHEAAADPFIADAYARAGKQRPAISTLVETARTAMRAAA
jgi:hypothetical protein